MDSAGRDGASHLVSGNRRTFIFIIYFFGIFITFVRPFIFFTIMFVF